LPNLKFLSLTVPEILGGPKIPKMGHVTPHYPINYSHYSLSFCVVFEVSSFNHPRDIRVPKIPKVGHVIST